MIIERERLTAELLMLSGDTLTRQLTENMTLLSTTSSLGHFLTVDVPSAARRLMMEGDPWQGNLEGRLPFDEVVAIKDRIQALADSISNTVADIRKSIEEEGSARGHGPIHDATTIDRLLEEIAMEHKSCTELILDGRRKVLDPIAEAFNHLWTDQPAWEGEITVSSSAHPHRSHGGFVKEVERELEGWYTPLAEDEADAADPEAIGEAMEMAARGVRQEMIKLRRDLMDRARTTVAQSRKTRQQQQRGVKALNTTHEGRLTLHNLIPDKGRVTEVAPWHVEEVISARVQGVKGDVRRRRLMEARRVAHDCRSKLVPILITSLLCLRADLIADHPPTLPSSGSNKRRRGANRAIPTTESLCYYLTLLKPSTSWRVKLAMSILSAVCLHGTAEARKRIADELEEVAIDEENRQSLRTVLDSRIDDED
ncbi:hypothetical protein FOZ60_001872 [Perkinsus olseni]|uniref:Uncharacterized protein n=1 Tax=Perkinsus olseni TaxID=32597 RepID=A0A7J6PJ44_PEROL|nr:hypothetical protein FOZ60_001872 [Perkinsus olseni]